jgi:hypothetical protein
MNSKKYLITFAAFGALVALIVSGCGQNKTSTPINSGGSKSASSGLPSALPDNGFKALITLVDPPVKLRAGQKETIQVSVRNASDVLWYARGAAVNTSPDNKFYIAVGDSWLNAADQKLVTNMDGRYGLNRDLKPGEQTQVPLLITAPKEPGDYILDIDLVQEQVAWFHDKGSPTAQTKITVVR